MGELVTYLQNNEPQFRKARLAALYSDFRPLRTLNPDGYNANISAWIKGLSSAALAGAVPSSSSTPNLLTLAIDNELLRELDTKEWGRPLALGVVIREAMSRREMMTLKEFEESEESIYTPKSGWALAIPLSPWGVLKWGAGKLGLVGGANEEKLLNERVVILGNVEEVGKELMRRTDGIKGRTERIFSKTAFKEAFGDVCGNKRPLSESDLGVLLRFLERDKQVLAFDGETIKLKAPGEAAASPITSEDTTIVSLKTLIQDLERQTEALTAKVDELNSTAKDAVVRKNRVAAMAALRSKKLTENTLTKRHATLGQLEEVFAKIEQAADQVELVRVMEASTRVLSGFNKEVGGIERVDNVVDQLREQMSQVDEVGNVIAEVGQEAVVVDETEVDDEFEAMEREEREKREKKEQAEREEREKKEQAEREEREKREAAETRRRLDALEQVEREASKAKEGAAKQQDEAITEQAIEDSMNQMKRMSLEPTQGLE